MESHLIQGGCSKTQAKEVFHEVPKAIDHVYMDFNSTYEDEYVLDKNH